MTDASGNSGQTRIESPSQPRARSRWRPALAVVALLGLGGVIGAGVVHAQMGGWGGGWRHDGPHWGGMGPMQGPRGGGMGSMQGPRGAMRFARFCANDTARYQPALRAFVKADLRLSDAQAKEFDALADQTFPALEGVKKEACDNFAAISDKAPDRLAQFSAVLRKAADAVDKSVEPAKKFYASLDAQQQARVDELADRRGRWR